MSLIRTQLRTLPPGDRLPQAASRIKAPGGVSLLEVKLVELPFMELWTQRFFGSARVKGLTGWGESLYLKLLALEWGLQGKGLPNEQGELSRLCRIHEEEFRREWGDGQSGVSQFFVLRGGRLFNDKLESRLKNAIGLQKTRSKLGKAGRQKQLESLRASSPDPGRARAEPGHRAYGDGDGSSATGTEGPEVQGTMGTDGDAREVETLRARLEGGYEQGAYELTEKIQRFALCSPSKAMAIYARLREPKAETLAAWVRYETVHGTHATVGAMQGHTHPSEVREKVADTVTTDASRAWTAERRQEAVVKKRSNEIILESAKAKEEAVPPPPEFLEAIGKLRRVTTP